MAFSLREALWDVGNMGPQEKRESRISKRKLSYPSKMLAKKDPRKECLSNSPGICKTQQPKVHHSNVPEMGLVLVNLRYKGLEQHLEATIMDVTDLKPDADGMPRRNAMTARLTVISDVVNSPRVSVPHGRLFAGSSRKTCDFKVAEKRLQAEVLRIEILRDGTSPYAEAYVSFADMYQKCTETSSTSTPIRSQSWHRLFHARDPILPASTPRSTGRGTIGNSRRIRRSSSGGSGTGSEHGRHPDPRPFIAWLREDEERRMDHQRSNFTPSQCVDEELPGIARLVSYRSAQWQAVASEDREGVIDAAPDARGHVVWELFTSECAHLATVSYLCDPFLSTMRRVSSLCSLCAFNKTEVPYRSNTSASNISTAKQTDTTDCTVQGCTDVVVSPCQVVPRDNFCKH
eukprot:m.935680 g.935680  ORF g.935680 m.935680 type:complete len:403 (-) comp23805_c1_seq4:3661-4869(-)